MSAVAATSAVVVGVTWAGDRRFDVGRFDARALRLDGDSVTGASPCDAFIGAVAACAATDLLSILEKQGAAVESLEVRVEAVRPVDPPRRLESLILHFAIGGKGITEARAERAIELSVTKYCGVCASLDPDLSVSWTVTL